MVRIVRVLAWAVVLMLFFSGCSGITWQVRSSDVTVVEIYAHSQKRPTIVNQRAGLLTVYLI